jgi:enterochelin esterase-like enzyme
LLRDALGGIVMVSNRMKVAWAVRSSACLLLLLPAAVFAQQAQPAKPAAAQTPRIASPTEAMQRGAAAMVVSPEIAADGRVTFRLYAPDAREVSVLGEFTAGAKLAMTKDDAGVWSVVSGPIAPEQYFYFFNVDGVMINDPRNPRTNMLIVPGPASSAFEVRDVPHGELRQVWYRSATMGLPRRMFVYTPPGYEKSKEMYPVLYLLHGWGGDEEEWTNAGFLPQLMDNLLAEGKIKPMVVVMPNGHPDEQAAPHVLPSAAQPGMPTQEVSEVHTRLSAQGMMEDVIPFIEANYRVKTDRDDRAIAGLSMGGEQATYIGLNHLDRFAWIGAFSPAYVMLPGRKAPADQKDTSVDRDAFEQNFPHLNASANQELHLFYITCGLDDFLLKADRDMKEWLRTKDVKFVDVETAGYAHVWRYWRVNLIDFAPRLFR